MSVQKFVLLVAMIFTGSVFAGPVDFTPHGTQPGLLFGIENSRTCADCHSTDVLPTPGNKPDFAPQNTWRGSMMANAARDPLFWAALDVANNDLPGVGDWCLRCHVPVGWYGGRVVKQAFGAGIIDGANGCELRGDLTQQDNKTNDFSGVTCHICHRVESEGPNGEGFLIGNADIWLDDENCDTGFGPCRKGPYDYAGGGPNPPHAWEHSEFISSSEMCGSCHQVSSPDTGSGPAVTLIDESGTDTGLAMPNDRTYGEWKASDFADVIYADSIEPIPNRVTRTLDCQSCHMPQTNDPDAKACFGFPAFPDGVRAGDLAVHEFVGGSVWMPKVLDEQYGSELVRSDDYQRSASLAEAMLQQSADLEITASNYDDTTGALSVDVRVTNRSGHKLPSGYAEGRRMWLAIEVRDASEGVVYQAGQFNPSTGSVLGLENTMVYEAIPGVWNAGMGLCETEDNEGDKQFHLVLNNCIAKDTRIPPKGFTAGTTPDMQPVGITYPAVSPGKLAHFSDVALTANINPATTTPISVDVKLMYQSLSKDYVEFLRDEALEQSFADENSMCMRPDPGGNPYPGPNDQTRGAFMYDLWNTSAHGKSPPVEMETLTVQEQ